MSKSYTALRSEIISILAKAELAIRARVAELDCETQEPRNLDLDVIDEDYCGCSVSMIDALEDIVEKNNKGLIHSDYQTDMKNIESFLAKLKADEDRIKSVNGDALTVRGRAMAEIKLERDAEIAELVGNQVLLNVRVKTGKLSEDQVKAVNALFAEKGFVGGVVQGTNWSNFIGLAECSADDLYAEVVSAVPNTTKNFIGKKVKVSQYDLANSFHAEVRNIVGY